jgi:hypothetical protein
MVVECVNLKLRHDKITGIDINPGGLDGSPANWHAGPHYGGENTEMLNREVSNVVAALLAEFDISD